MCRRMPHRFEKVLSLLIPREHRIVSTWNLDKVETRISLQSGVHVREFVVYIA